jgi:hypothetical protein
MNGTHQLRVLIANQRPERLELLSKVVIGLGHKVIARVPTWPWLGSATARSMRWR